MTGTQGLRFGASVPGLLVLLTGLAIMPTACSDNTIAPEQPGDGLEYVTPEQVGWSSDQLAAVDTLAEQSGFSAVMAVYDGKVFLSWGNVSRNYRCHSIRKPFLSALYGIHLSRQELCLDTTLDTLGMDDIPPSLTAAEKQATVRHLLQSRSGVYHVAAAETEDMAASRPPRGSHPPGSYYYYNNWDFNVAGTIFRQETGLDIFSAFAQEIASPIGMQDFVDTNCVYEYELTKSMHPAYAFRMSARDMARFGVLYQRNGRWQGRQIIPAEWIAESTTAYSTVDSASGVGYGYLWNVIPTGSPIAGLLGASGYYHTGLGVHMLIVVPDLKLVIVERVDTDGAWSDPGEAGLQLVLLIINARQKASL